MALRPSPVYRAPVLLADVTVRNAGFLVRERVYRTTVEARSQVGGSGGQGRWASTGEAHP